MADLTLRRVKLAPLTHFELDDNFLAIDSVVNALGTEVDALETRIDSEHAWNVAEHQLLDDRIDSEHAWNVAEHIQLQYEVHIDNFSPANPSSGDLWLDKKVNQLYIYDGSVWFQAPQKD